MTVFNRSRQLDIFRPEQATTPFTIIGAGGVGSITTVLLAKMGIRDITVFDFDTVDDVNLPSQMYGAEDLGKPKVVALQDVVSRFTDCRIQAVPERYENQPLTGMVIAAADCMATRKRIWEAVKLNPASELLIDARMGGQVMQILTARPCDPEDIEHYEQFLFSDEEASPVPCGAQAIAYNTFGIASMICAIVRKWLTESEAPCRVVGDFSTLTFLTMSRE